MALREMNQPISHHVTVGISHRIGSMRTDERHSFTHQFDARSRGEHVHVEANDCHLTAQHDELSHCLTNSPSHIDTRLGYLVVGLDFEVSQAGDKRIGAVPELAAGVLQQLHSVALIELGQGAI
ncbi:hypothetical protein AI2916V1_4762 (plasmid) [Enterobacter cloacae]|nr:hypothetical protein AI2916V1_4762 [Enterobacter cloacae]